MTNDDLPYFRDPLMQYVRYGSSGILVVLGGRIAGGDDAGFRQMNSIQVYDIAADNWSTQIATEDSPLTGTTYCAAVSAAPHDSSKHLVLYGGWTNTQGVIDKHADKAGVYILIMPAFHWIKINTAQVNGLSHTTDVRTGQTCVAYKDRQLLVFGGNYNDTGHTCTSTFSPLRCST